MHLYAFVQAAEIWVKTESHSRGYLRMGSAFGNGQRKRKVDVGVMPPQSFLIVLQPGGEISPTRSNLSSSDPLRSAARSDQALSIQSGDAQQLHRKKKKEKKKVCSERS